MSLVLDLQALAQDGSTDVVELVRRSKVVATKLKLTEFVKRLDLELSGYTERATIPDYRLVRTELVSHNPFHGTHPVQWSGSGGLYDHFSKSAVGQPLAVLVSLLKASQADRGSGPLLIPLTPEELKLVLEATDSSGGIGFSRRVDAGAVHGIVDAVRNEILQWSLELEGAGILGEGMTFSRKEQAVAQESQVIHNYGLLVQGDNASAAQAQNSPGAAVAASQSGGALARLESLGPMMNSVNPDVSAALGGLIAALRTDKVLADEQKNEAAEHLVVLTQQVLTKAEQRTPTVARLVGTRLRELLSLSADILQVWIATAPVFARALGFPIG